MYEVKISHVCPFIGQTFTRRPKSIRRQINANKIETYKVGEKVETEYKIRSPLELIWVTARVKEIKNYEYRVTVLDDIDYMQGKVITRYPSKMRKSYTRFGCLIKKHKFDNRCLVKNE